MIKLPENKTLWVIGGIGLLVLATARAGSQMANPAPGVNPGEPPSDPPDGKPTPPGSPPPGKTSCGYPAQIPVVAPPKTTAELIGRVKAIILSENPKAEQNARHPSEPFGGYTGKTPFVDVLADALVRSAKLYKLPIDLLVAHCRVESTFGYYLRDEYIRKQADGVTRGCPRPWPTRKNSEGKSYLVGRAIGPLQVKTFTASDRGFCFVKWLPENQADGDCNFYLFGRCVSKPDPRDPRRGLDPEMRVLLAVQAGAAHLRYTRDRMVAAGYREWCHASEAYYTGVSGFINDNKRNKTYLGKVVAAAARFSELRLS